VGGWQFYAFGNGEFPMPGLYVNQSFLSVQENTETIAKYIQRPFGLFPEPSAMSSSLAPFVLLWIAMACGIIRLRQEPRRWQRILFNIAAAGGVGLIILSRSGHCAVTLLAAGVLAAMWLMRARATPKTFVTILIVCAVVLPLIGWAATAALSDRIGGDAEYGNSSWEERSTSLALGFELMTQRDAKTLVFGMGVGQSSPAIYAISHIDAVFSVLLPYVYETGLIGAAVLIVIGIYLMRTWQRSGFDIAFILILVVWLVGVTVTTSYSQLLSLWVALGWLTIWPELVVPNLRREAKVLS
jgi:hypothetical protein